MLKNIASYSAWQATGQALSAASLFAVSLVLPAAALADYGLAITVASAMVSVLTLRIEQAILVAKEDGEAGMLAWAAAGLAILIAAFLSLIAFVAPSDWKVVHVLPAGVAYALASSVVSVQQQLLIRRGKSALAGRVAAVRALVTGLIVVGAAYTGDRGNADAVLLAIWVSSVLVACISVVDVWRILGKPYDFARMKMAVSGCSDVWKSYFWQSALSGVSLNMPYFVFYSLYEPVLSSGYLLAERIVRLPINLISVSVRGHLLNDFRKLMSRGDRDKCRQVVRRWSVHLFSIGVVWAVLAAATVWFWAYTHLGDAKWKAAAACIAVMALWSGATLSNSPSTAALTVTRNNRYILNAQVVEFVCRALVLCAAFVAGSSLFYIIVFASNLPSVAQRFFVYRKSMAVM